MTGARSPSREGGFTLIELLIVVAIIGIISALLVPNLMTGLQNANQTRTQADMKSVGTAWMQWLTDQVSAAAAGSSTTATFTWSEFTYPDFAHADLYALLRPSNTFFYMQNVPERDGWNHPYRYGFAGSDKLLSTQVLGIWSGGRDGSTTAQPDSSYEIGAFPGTDFDQDLVWADGYWVRWPGSAAEAAAREGTD